MPTPTTILSILGLEHSGTTLLVRILNNHPDAVSIGGMKNLTPFATGRRPCSCGATYGGCPVWQDVENELQKRGRQLANISEAIQTRDAATIHDFCAAAAASFRQPLLIESSRQPSYLDLLPGPPDFRATAVHIFKHPAAQASSAHRAGRSVLREMRHYRRRSHAILRRLSNHPAALHVSHEDFCADPDTHLRRILALAGLEPAPGQLATWGEKDMHIIGGNRMKKDRSSTIKTGNSWQQSLPLVPRLLARLLGAAPYRRNLAAARTSAKT
jgi:hypothetical protein